MSNRVKSSARGITLDPMAEADTLIRMGTIHRRRLTEAKIRKAIASLNKKPEAQRTLTQLSRILDVPYGDLRTKLREYQIGPLRDPLPEIKKSQIEAAFSKITGAPTLTGVAILLGVSPARLKRAWETFGFKPPARGRPPETRIEDEIDQRIRDHTGTDVALATELCITKEAIRQRREIMGLPTHEQRRKKFALFELLNGARPAVVAERFGFTVPSVKKWQTDLIKEPICLERNCGKNATVKSDPEFIAPNLCKKHNA